MNQRICTVDGCTRERGESRLYCTMHYQRVRRYGAPGEARERKAPTSLSNRDRFARIGWTEVTRRPELGPCWEWNGVRLSRSGYGQVSLQSRRTAMAHRTSYVLHVGPIPDGMEVCHRCDNPPCVNPAHLFLGTRRENAADMVAKHRDLRGSRSPYAKLTFEQADAIRAEYAAGGISQTEIAERYGVKQAGISRVIRGVSY